MRFVKGLRSPKHAESTALQMTNTTGVDIERRTRRNTPSAGEPCRYIGGHDPGDHNSKGERSAHHRGPGADCDTGWTGIAPPTPQRRETGGSRCAVQMWGLGDEALL